jgi:AbrB family looped-hinge helix DNA binding protein
MTVWNLEEIMAEIGVRVQEKGQVTIPRRIREKLNLKQGDLVLFVETEQGVMVKPASVVTDDALRTEVKAVVRSIREKFADSSAEEIESLVDEAIRETREKRG